MGLRWPVVLFGPALDQACEMGRPAEYIGPSIDGVVHHLNQIVISRSLPTDPLLG